MKPVINLFIIPLFLFIVLPSFSAAEQISASPSVFYREKTADFIYLPVFLYKALQQPDYIELPLILSRDDRLVVSPTIRLDNFTNVKDLYPDRIRDDGKYYFIDFTWAELQQITVTTAIDSSPSQGHFFSFSDAVAIGHLLEKQNGKAPVYVPTVLFPRFHRNEGKDIAKVVVKAAVSQLGTQDETAIYIQSYDPEEVKYLGTLTAADLLPVQLIQGIAPHQYAQENMEHYSYDLLFTRFGIRALASYTFAIAVVSLEDIHQTALLRLTEDAKTLEMKIFISESVLAPQNKSTEPQQTPLSSKCDGFITTDPAQLEEKLELRVRAAPHTQSEEATVP